jgi:hypothetical protein
MNITENCKYCNSFNIIKSNDIYSCCDCSSCYTTSSKRITTISSPSNNKTIHCINVLKEISHINISDQDFEEFKKIIASNNINIKSITTSLASEFLKSKGIKNYRKTHKLINKTISETNSELSKEDIYRIFIIFRDFVQYIYKNKYTKTISYEYYLAKIFELLNLSYVIKFSYNKTNKRDDKPEIWNNYKIDIYNRSYDKNLTNFIFLPNTNIYNEYIKNRFKLRNIS